MTIGKVHHIGYLVKRIEKSIKSFQSLGYSIDSNIYFDEERLSDICFLRKNDIKVELVEPHKESDIYPLLKKYSNSIYHVCYMVDNISEAINELKAQGWLLFRDIQKAYAISETAEVVFLIHTNMGIIELVQED